MCQKPSAFFPIASVTNLSQTQCLKTIYTFSFMVLEVRYARHPKINGLTSRNQKLVFLLDALAKNAPCLFVFRGCPHPQWSMTPHLYLCFPGHVFIFLTLALLSPSYTNTCNYSRPTQVQDSLLTARFLLNHICKILYCVM